MADQQHANQSGEFVRMKCPVDVTPGYLTRAVPGSRSGQLEYQDLKNKEESNKQTNKKETKKESEKKERKKERKKEGRKKEEIRKNKRNLISSLCLISRSTM